MNETYARAPVPGHEHEPLHGCVCELASYLAAHGGARSASSLKQLMHDAHRIHEMLKEHLAPDERRALCWVWPAPGATGDREYDPEQMAHLMAVRLTRLLQECDVDDYASGTWYGLRRKLPHVIDELSRRGPASR